MAYQSEVEKLTAQWNAKPEQYFAPLADAYRKAGDIDMALEVVRAGLVKRPNNLSAHIVLGRCLLDQKNDTEAAHAFEHVLELDAENIIAIRVLGEVAERKGDPEGAYKWVTRLLEVDPNNEDAQETLKRLEPAARAMPVAAPEAVAGPAAAPEPAAAAGAAPSGFEPTSFASAPTAERPAVKLPSAGPDSGVIALEPAEPAMPDLAAMSAVSSLGVERAESAIESAGPAVGGGGGADSGLELAEEMVLSAKPSAEFETSTDAMAAPAAARDPDPELIPLDEPTSVPLPLMDFSEPTPAAEPLPMLDLAESVAAAAAPKGRASQALKPPAGITLIMPDESPPAAAPAPAPIPIHESMAETVEVEPVITETMAEVYLKQGLVHEARDVYRKLVERRPADTALRSRLAALEQRVSGAPSPATGGQRPRYAAAETGGQAARSMFSQVLSARVAARQAAAAHAGTGSTGAALDAAFANDPAPGAPTSPAGDELSLAAVFGEEPSPAPAAAPPPAPSPGAQGFSFDEFFGGKKPEPKAAAPAPPADAEPTPGDFVSWLKGLKS